MECRICGKKIIECIFSLGDQPISNNYLPAGIIAENVYPLDLFFCDECLFLQIDEVVSAKDIFCNDYPYVSSVSSSWLSHCDAYSDLMIEKFKLNKDSYVMEIASNDGYLLDFFNKKGITVRGVEPSRGVADMAIAKGIETDVEFFCADYADRMRAAGHRPNLIAGNNVIAHNPNVVDFVEGVSILLAEGGVFTVEFPHLANLIKYYQFDTIYHEHYSYFSLNSIIKLFHKCGLTVFDVDLLPTHGGSLRVYGKRSGDFTHSVNHATLSKVIGKEEGTGIYAEKTYVKFNEAIEKIRDTTLDFLIDQHILGNRVVGYGAPAKGNTFLNYCGIDSSLIEYTVDRSDYKVGKKLPGSRIPIYNVDKILKDMPDYIFILPWNIKEEIVDFLGKDKAKFVTAIPRLEIT